MPTNESKNEIYARDRDEWMSWLEENHETSDVIELIYYKSGSGKESVTYNEAVEEALCFGWIDSRVKSIDDTRYKQRYTKRRPGSIWAKSNKERVERLIANGRMTDAGMAVIIRARQDGSWNALDAAENLIEPEILSTALDTEPRARAGYDAYPDSLKKSIIYWVTSAKRDETKRRRVDRTVDAAIEGKPPVQ